MRRVSRDEYSASLTKGSLKPQQVRTLAILLNEGHSPIEAVEKIIAENLFQMRSSESARTLVNYQLRRLSTVTPCLIEVSATGTFREITQASLVAALSESKLLRSFFFFIETNMRSGGRRFLAPSDWASFVDWLEGQDPSVARWTPTSLSKLRQNIWRILAESEVTDNTKNMRLQSVRLEPRVRKCLEDPYYHEVNKTLEAGGFE